MNFLKFVFVFVFLLMASCQMGFPPSFVTSRPHAKSPDGNAYIYQSEAFLIDGKYQSGIVSWMLVNKQAGGVGLFDFKSEMPDVFLSMYWTSDSTAVVEYPTNVEVMRKEESGFFFGRSINVKYLEKYAD